MADVALRAQRPSVGRIILPGLGALFMAALSVASIVNAASGGTAAIVLMIVILATTAWLWWDVLKLVALAPLARVSVHENSVRVRRPLTPTLGSGGAMRAHEPLRLEIMRQSSFLGAAYLYRFVQDQTRVTIVGPSPVLESDLDTLRTLLEERGGELEVAVMEIGRGRGRA